MVWQSVMVGMTGNSVDVITNIFLLAFVT